MRPKQVAQGGVMTVRKSQTQTKPAIKKPRGRPSFTPEQIALATDEICRRIAIGESLKKICSDASMPSYTTVYEWLATDSSFSDKYARAREQQMEHYAREIIEICDDSTGDVIIDPETGQERVNHEFVARSKLRVDTRKWLMSKLAPKKYGDKTILAGDDKNPIRVQAVAMDTDKLSVEELETLRKLAEKAAIEAPDNGA